MMEGYFAPAPKPVVPLRSDPSANSTCPDSSAAQTNKNQWTDAEERIIIELFDEN